MANIVIAGANQGIGYALVEQLLRNGHAVAALDCQVDHLESLQRAFPRLLFRQADVRQDKAVGEAISELCIELGSADVAIHNACRCTFAREEDTSLAEYREVFDVNYYGALRLVKCVLPWMQAQKRGRVIFVSSGVGITGFPGVSAYASTKAALEALAKCLNLEYARENITFHIAHPPLTQTQSSAPLPIPKEFMAIPQKVGQGLARQILSKRLILCPSRWQKIQTMACYWFPVKMGRLLAKMTERAQKQD